MKNSIIDINEGRIKQFNESLRPKDITTRDELDYSYSYDGKIVIFSEVGSHWRNPEEVISMEFAKIRYYKSRREWNLYWMRANGAWELYEPFPKSRFLDVLLDVIKKDEHHCFFG